MHNCGKPATVAHHIVGRDNKRTRHMMNNGIAFCQKCHDWAHAKPRAFLALLHFLYPLRLSVWTSRHYLLTVPYRMWMEERMKELLHDL